MSGTDIPETDLTLDGPSLLGRWSARGARHLLTPLPRGEFWRDQNGTAHFAPLPGARYMLSLSASDVRPPAFATLWPGAPVTVGAAIRLGIILGPGTDTWDAERPLLADSVRAFRADGAAHPVLDIQDRHVTVGAHDTPVCVSARPVLAMMVREWSLGLEEWDGLHPWRLVLEEI
ncbi:hypothetical protein [Pararhodospirillum oryzae]|uniref:Uncharacterized protein n=1 Tax=Pararhodospirillum oryzae TaxID=478448 RepID=A0A512H4U0_9PROT|nr:hypothetical protein [Pararhodospirillum oryzae]GEO80438.1 hypothetical protein ROR02_05690 [Pararhodospirillum oryzae]